MHLIDLPPFLQGRQLLSLPVFFPTHQVPSKKGSTLKGKHLLPVGANAFLLVLIPFQKGVTPFQKGVQNNFERHLYESAPIHLKVRMNVMKSRDRVYPNI